MFKALGDPTRLRIFMFLSSCSPEVVVGEEGEVRPVVGATVGDVCCHVSGGNSLVSFHLKELRQAGLITMERRGKYMVCRIHTKAVEELGSFMCDPCGCQ